MRYFILFFCLLFGQNTTIQANYSAPQTANYQIISADIANPIEPIKPKKSRKIATENFGEVIGGILSGTLVVLIAAALLSPLSFGLFYGILWLWIVGASIQAILLFICFFVIISGLYGVLFEKKNSKIEDPIDRKAQRGVTPEFLSLIGAAMLAGLIGLNAINLAVLGIIFNIPWLWIACVAYIIVCIAVYLIAGMG